MLTRLHESHCIRDILKLIRHESWVLLDLDNTVMESWLELGGDQWFSKLIEHACEHMPDNTSIAIELVITIYKAVQHYIRTKSVEPDVVSVIRMLQDSGIPVIAITARDHTLLETTFRQLDEIDIDFSRNQEGHRPTVYLGDDEALYHGGIIFCNGTDKGICLSAFLEKCTTKPRHVIMVDDKRKHLQHVQHAVQALQIEFDGLRYGYLDEKVNNLDMKNAHEQLAYLKDKLPPVIQNAIAALQINFTEAATHGNDYLNYIAPDPLKKSLRRKQEEVLRIEREVPERPSSSLSFFARRPREDGGCRSHVQPKEQHRPRY